MTSKGLITINFKYMRKLIENIKAKFSRKPLLVIPDVSGSLTPFGVSIKLLRDLADLQNGAPLEQHRKEWEETMEQVYDFLNRWEGQ
jgi:hypothetical protein